MKKMLTVILTVAMLMTAATAFADGGEGEPMSGPQMGGPQMDGQMGGPMGGPQMDGQMNGPMGGPQMDGQMNGPMDGPQMDGQMNGPMGGPQPGGNGEQQPPEKPADGQAPENNQQPPEKPNGEKPADAPAEPEEQNGEQQTPENNQQPPEKPADGQAPANGQQPPDKPADGQQPPEKPANGQQGPQMPSNNQQGSQMPMNGQQAPGMIDFDALVTEGVISQETREKIRTFMDEHKPADMPSDGQAPADGQQSPEMPPEGQAPNGGQPDLLSDLKEAGILTQEECDAISSATVNNAQMPGGQGMPGGEGMPGGMMPGGFPGESGNVEYASATTVTEDADGATYSSTGEGENAVLISGSQVALTNATVTKTGSSNSGEADFNGINAAVLATSGSTVTLSDASVTTDGMHANGVFSYGAGTTVNVSDTTITTTGNCSGGLMTTGGATMNASNLTVSTAGNSSAAIRSDRGGGTVNVASGTYDTAGVGSPAIYSTADITVSDATLKATNSEAVVIEGGNSVTLKNVDITGSNGQLNGQSTHKTNVLIYQSMSGDASEGSSTFTMNGGTMTCETGSMFHVTNTTTTVNLNGVAFNYSADSSVFLDATADSWGASGSNGGNVTLNLTNQDITGAIVADSASTVAVNLDGNSTWTLGGDSYVTTFTGDLSRVNTNGYTLYVNGEAMA